MEERGKITNINLRNQCITAKKNLWLKLLLDPMGFDGAKMKTLQKQCVVAAEDHWGGGGGGG